ncbi:Coenzyme F420 hydrogenase subunit beta [ANME-1 cluster archaeon GoMg3.2]|nr:Coenzyme F420 hydrogenase subunit beta [ANME-1 cluster archaeon GoMg3.2]
MNQRNNNMETSNVMKTRELDLCVSCEICSAACPKGAVTMENKFGQFLPTVDDEKCTNCGLCLEICPGIDIDPFGLRHEKISDNTFDGPCLEGYTAYSNDPEIRKNSASGGLITNLITELIKDKEFDAAFILDFDKFDDKPARLKATDNINEILKAAKSKYIPASVYNIIKTLKKENGKKYIIVGTPCQIYGIKKFIKKFNISEENYLFLGLFCEKTLKFNILRYFEDNYGKSTEKLTKFDFKNKGKNGWPGDSKLYFDSGRNLFVDRKVRMQLKRFFQLNRCLFCFDKLNRLADISFGDCYIEGKGDFNGKSSVIVRTKKGREIFDKYSYLFTLEKESIEEIRKSQHLIDKKDNLEYAKIFIKEHSLYPDAISDYEIDSQAAKGLLKSQRNIKWGNNYNINKIKFNLFLTKCLKKVKRVRKFAIYGTMLALIIIRDFFIYPLTKKRNTKKKQNFNNVIIVGGELSNKGAQAMTFTVVDQVKRKFPNKNIYLFSVIDFDRDDKEKSIYKFNILPWDLKTKLWFLGFGGRLFKKNSKYGYLENHIKDVVKDVDFFIDISGYALSSQWGFLASVNYLLNIATAKKYSIPYYIFPQSIGPFNYSMKSKFFLYPLLNLYLKYPKKIFVREKEGIRSISKFTEKNIEKSYDIVLQSKGYNINNIYKDIHFKDIKIESNSVGIIPNLRVIERAKPDEIYSVYNSLINRLIDAEKRVYILRHSYEDLELCEKIKNCFPDTKCVRLIPDDLNAIELENIIKQFDFIIASRYHSIVHSYKNGVPALVIGWATKYFELLKNFDQLDYFFDGRDNIDIDEINNKLDKMIRNYKYEREKIINKMNILNKGNIFDMLFDSTKKDGIKRRKGGSV